MKILSPRNTLGVSGVISVAAKSNTIELTGDPLFKCKKTREKNKMSLHCSFGFIQVSASLTIQIQPEMVNVNLCSYSGAVFTSAHTHCTQALAQGYVVASLLPAVDMQAKNMVQMTPFRVKFECRGLQTLEWHNTINMEAFNVFFPCFFFHVSISNHHLLQLYWI